MSKTPLPSSSKRSRQETSPPTASSPNKQFEDILNSINTKLSCFDARLALVEDLHREFQALRESLEFSQQQVAELAAQNRELRDTVTSLSKEVTGLSADNKRMKESILDLQSRSMRDNLVFAGLPEKPEEDAEKSLRDFMQESLKIPADTVNKIVFARVHRLGGRRQENQRPRPIVAKFEHFKQKELVKSRGRELRGTDFSVNDQFPKEILDRRRLLFPIRKKFLAENSRAVITVDRLYVNGQLFRDPDITPWLY